MLRRLTAVREAGVILGVIAITIGFSVASPEFLTAGTWGNIVTVSAEVGLIAVGVTLLMITKEFDLSVGSNFALSAMIMATLIQNKGAPAWAAAAAALFAGTLVGWLNGFITVKTKIPSFITTLGAFMFWRGVVIALTGGWPVTLAEKPALLALFSGRLGESDFHMSFAWWAGFAFLAYMLLEHTPYGNWTLATGGKPESAFARGINTGRVRILNFALTGFLAALAGVIQLSRLESMSPTDGVGLELEAIAATVIGGTSLFGGKGTVLGTVLGTLLMGMLSTGLVLAGAPTYWFRAFIGLIIVVAVVFNTKFEHYSSRVRA